MKGFIPVRIWLATPICSCSSMAEVPILHVGYGGSIPPRSTMKIKHNKIRDIPMDDAGSSGKLKDGGGDEPSRDCGLKDAGGGGF